MAVINNVEPQIGGWCYFGCFFWLQADADLTLTSSTQTPGADNATEKYTGELVVVQGNTEWYGQRTDVKVFVISDNSILIERTLPAGTLNQPNEFIQYALLAKQPNVTFVGETYIEFRGITQGIGSENRESVIRFRPQ